MEREATRSSKSTDSTEGTSGRPTTKAGIQTTDKVSQLRIKNDFFTSRAGLGLMEVWIVVVVVLQKTIVFGIVQFKYFLK